MSKPTPKPEANWRSKSLESLEKSYWPAPESESHLATTCHQLRKKQLKEFEVEDLRIMIGQDIGLMYLVPLAIEVLQDNILAEGDLYAGDLLKALLTSDPDFWRSRPELWEQVKAVHAQNVSIIEKEAAEYGTGRDIVKAYKVFETLNAL